MKGWRGEAFAAGTAFCEFETGGEVLLEQGETQDGLREVAGAWGRSIVARPCL